MKKAIYFFILMQQQYVNVLPLNSKFIISESGGKRLISESGQLMITEGTA